MIKENCNFSPTAIALGSSAIVKASGQNCFRTLYGFCRRFHQRSAKVSPRFPQGCTKVSPRLADAVGDIVWAHCKKGIKRMVKSALIILLISIRDRMELGSIDWLRRRAFSEDRLARNILGELRCNLSQIGRTEQLMQPLDAVFFLHVAFPVPQFDRVSLWPYVSLCFHGPWLHFWMTTW